MTRERSKGFYEALDLIANFINTLPTLAAKEIRSEIYRKCIEPTYEYGINVPS